MFIRSLPIVIQFIDALNDSLSLIKPSHKLTRIQKIVIGAMITGIIMTEALNWAAFERRSLGVFKPTTLCWMFYKAKLAWQHMLQASITNIIEHYQLKSGHLDIDDTHKHRAKKTTCIAGAHKIKDKPTGGYINGQELIFMVLVTSTVTFPVGFRFYVPDPKLAVWSKQDKVLQQQGIAKKYRPKRPKPDHVNYPTKQALALKMLREFTTSFPDFNIVSVLADALYGTEYFMDEAEIITNHAQIVSQLRSNQIVASRNLKSRVDIYFNRQKSVELQLTIRGGEDKKVNITAARLYVNAHGKRRFVVALKYEGEEDYRYMIASNMSWHHHDIARLYTLRWLVEVFIQDWKAHCGWNKLSKQQGADGSEHGLILSLLCEHLLLQHPEQSIRLKNKRPGMPVGCLIERIKVEALVDTIREVVCANDPNAALKNLIVALHDSLPERDSSRHMSGRDLGNQEETPSLKSHAKIFQDMDYAA